MKTKKQSHRKLSVQMRVFLIVSLVIISVFPVFVTFAPQEWPLQPTVFVIDAAYLLILAGYLLVLSGQNRTRWLVTIMFAISVISVVALGWLALRLTTLDINW